LNPLASYQFDRAGPVWADEYGFRVLAIQPPGWADPPPPAEEYRPTALARRIVAWLDGIGIARTAYAGYSWGASIGCHLAVIAPERLSALVLLDAGYTDFQDQPGFREVTLEEATARIRERGMRFESWEAAVAELGPPARDAFREDQGAVVPLVPPEAAAAAGQGVVVERPSETLPRLGETGLPVLLVVATATLASLGEGPLARFCRAVPHAEIVTLESSHDLLRDAPDETIRIVGDFLA
jgi:pimeloyl-ACP methyl ester carboxylesterase